MKKYLENFEKLCDGLIFQYNYDNVKFEKFKNSIEYREPYNGIEPFDKTYQQNIGENLNLFYRRILFQPFWYLEAVDLFPNTLSDKEKILKRFDYLYGKIELAQDKFKWVLFSINVSLDSLVHNDQESAQRLFLEILFITNNVLRNIGSVSYNENQFNYKKSPLLIRLMEFIQEVKNRAGNTAPYYTEIEDYLKDIKEYKKEFTINSVNVTESHSKLVQNKIALSKGPMDSNVLKYYTDNCEQLLQSDNPESLLIELKANGFKYDTDELIRVIEHLIYLRKSSFHFTLSKLQNKKTKSIEILEIEEEIKKLQEIRLLFRPQTIPLSALEPKYNIAGIKESIQSANPKIGLKLVEDPFSDKTIIKVKEYLPLYGYFWNDDYSIIIDNIKYSMIELFEQQEIELTAIHIECLDSNDRLSFKERLSLIHEEDYLIEFFRDTLDDYKSNGGDPLYWIIQTLEDIELNYSNYLAKYRGLIQKHLIEWLEFYEKTKKWSINGNLQKNIAATFNDISLVSNSVDTKKTPGKSMKGNFFSDLKVVKVKDYRPLYNDLLNNQSDIIYNDEIITIDELLLQPEAELDSNNLSDIDHIDKFVFRIDLGKIETEKQIIEFLRNTLDDYRIRGGEPLHWITSTLFEIEENFESYPAQYRGLIQKHLLDWLVYYEKANKWNTNSELQVNTDAGNKEVSPLIPLPMKEYLNETSKEYIANYKARLNHFVSELEATEIDFIEKESEFLENCIYDIKNSQAALDGHSLTGITNFLVLDEIVEEIGYDKFHYSTLRKLEFLAEKKKNHILMLNTTTIQPDFKNNLDTDNHDSSKELVDIFINPKHKDLCIGILKKLSPAVINAHNEYIPGSLKGIFPLWIEILRDHKPNPIIKPLHALVYKDWLNSIFVGLDLTKDASEFRKDYPSLEKKNIPSDLKLFLSQLSLPED